VELRTPNYLTALGLKKVTQKLGMDDKFDATTVAIYFREENVTKKGSVFCRYGTRKNRLSSTHIFRSATMGENSTEGVVDKNNKIFDTRTFILSIAP
jgi:cholesterol oxidase